jgi:glycosyltransferase involved in cell wall biosynthesis
LVTVILPVYNGERFVAEALASVFRQQHDPLEVIIIDDGSTDGTADAVAHFGNLVKYRLQANRGPASARNAGLNEAKGEFIAFIDADDIWPDNKLALHFEAFAKSQSLEVVSGRVQYALLERLTDGRESFTPFDQPSYGVNLGAGLFKRSVFSTVGMFEPGLRHSEDVDFFLRLREAGVRMSVLEAVTLIYRIHDDNLSRDRVKGRELFHMALKKSLDRRRHKGSGEASNLPELDKPGL